MKISDLRMYIKNRRLLREAHNANLAPVKSMLDEIAAFEQAHPGAKKEYDDRLALAENEKEIAMLQAKIDRHPRRVQIVQTTIHNAERNRHRAGVRSAQLNLADLEAAHADDLATLAMLKEWSATLAAGLPDPPRVPLAIGKRPPTGRPRRASRTDSELIADSLRYCTLLRQTLAYDPTAGTLHRTATVARDGRTLRPLATPRPLAMMRPANNSPAYVQPAPGAPPIPMALVVARLLDAPAATWYAPAQPPFGDGSWRLANLATLDPVHLGLHRSHPDELA